mgnify:CR=1 FL=1
MHEMAIAQGILDIALDYGKREQTQKIREIGLLLGEMSGVVRESLEFSFAMLSCGTMAEGAVLNIENVPLVGRCDKCHEEFHIEKYNFLCPKCKMPLAILSGREMQVKYLEVD